MKQNYQAIALTKYDVGELDRIYVLYARERGLIRVKARGVRRPQAKLAAHVEDFVVSEVEVVAGRGLDVLTGAFTTSSHTGLRERLGCLLLLSSVRSQFLHVIHDEQKDEAVYDLLLTLLGYLDGVDDDVQAHFLCIAFLVRLYKHLGYEMVLDRCALSGEALSVDDVLYFLPAGGGVINALSARSRPEAQVMSHNALKALRLIYTQSFAHVHKLRLSHKDVRELERLVKDLYLWIMR